MPPGAKREGLRPRGGGGGAKNRSAGGMAASAFCWQPACLREHRMLAVTLRSGKSAGAERVACQSCLDWRDTCGTH